MDAVLKQGRAIRARRRAGRRGGAVTYTDGTTSPVTIKSLGGYRFFAYLIPVDETLKTITAFDAAGKALPTQNKGR